MVSLVNLTNMQFDIITIFPNLFNSFLEESLIKKAIEKKIFSINIHNLRDFSTDKHNQVDDRPFGGGPGMVLKINPIYSALQSIKQPNANSKILLLSPTGTQFNQEYAEKLSPMNQIVLIAGRYEGIDARIENFIDDKISVGPYITNGGELPSMIIIETIARLLPGFVGNPQSLKEDNSEKLAVITQKKEYPVYTRPESFIASDGQTFDVPKELLSGDHAVIKAWREQHQAE